ncbi:MAG: outer membrane protein assembly factor BamD [Verrucomicrobiota bacterium]
MAFTHAWRRLHLPFIAIIGLLAGSSPLVADLVWEPATGWRVEGGVLANFVENDDSRGALDHMNKARAAEEAGDDSAAIKRYKIVAKDYASSVFAAEANFRLGKLWTEGRRFYKAFDALQVIVDKHPNYERFTETIGAQYRIATALVNGERNRIWGLIPGFKNRGQGIEYLETIIRTAPYSDYAPLGLMTIARAHQRLGQSDEAIDALDRMVNDYPQSFLAPDAYLNLAQAHSELVQGPQYDQASTQQALTYYQDFLILFPEDPAAPDAGTGLTDMRTMLAESKMQMAEFYDKYRSNHTAARVFYNEAITIFPDSPVAERARTRLARIDAILSGEAPAEPSPAKPAPPAKKRFWLF